MQGRHSSNGGRMITGPGVTAAHLVSYAFRMMQVHRLVTWYVHMPSAAAERCTHDFWTHQHACMCWGGRT
jgi:hypothetical protein